MEPARVNRCRTAVRIALVAAALLVPSTSVAGDLTTLHSLEVRDASHRVEVTVDGRVARLRIAHRLVSRDRPGDEAFLTVDLPAGGAAVGLRARARGRWLGGRLLDAEAAGDRYEERTTGGRPGGGRGAALLSWQEGGQALLSVFPVARRQPAEVEIAAVAPLCYQGELAVAHLPLPGADSVAAPSVAVRGGGRHWLVRPGARPPAAIASRWRELADRCGDPDAAELAIVLERAPRAPVSAAAASLDLASGRRALWIEVDAARELAPAPHGARVLFVLDGSRSLGAARMAAQLALVQGYLAALPDASVEIVVYRRRATRLLGRFQPARRAAELLARVPARALALENGSHLDGGLALAGSLARGAAGPVRVIAFSDDLVRGALDGRAMAAALGRLPAGSIAHLVELEAAAGADPFSWQRTDSHPFAAAVMATGGMLVSMSGGDPATARAAMRGLVRPLVVDGFRIDGAPGDLAADLDDDGALPAGRGLRLTALLPAGAPRDPLVARGRIWGRELALPIAADRSLDAALPALLVGAPSLDLDDAELADAARRGGAVSRVTSILVELDDRPTAHDEMLGSSGCGCDAGATLGGRGTGVGSIGTVRRGPAARPPDRDALLAGALAVPLRACAALHGDAPLTLTVETTLDEVVDVSVAGVQGALAACAAEAAWALALPAAFDQAHATFRVPFEGAPVSRGRRGSSPAGGRTGSERRPGTRPGGR